MGQLSDRLKARDLSLWPQDSVAADFLGWMRYPNLTVEEIEGIVSFANNIDSSHIIYVGMGGSSLGAMMLCEFESARGANNGRKITFVDSTHPHGIASLETTDTTVVLASKSGTTTEVDSIFEHLWDRMRRPEQYVVLTDPNTPLEIRARERGIRRVLNTPADVGGRYSVLTPFGTVAGALLGMDLQLLFEGARSTVFEKSEQRALEIYQLYTEGKDKLALLGDSDLLRTPMWLEQLIAESLGKSNKGIVPVPFDQTPDQPDRQVATLTTTSHQELGRMIFEWELTTALLGALMEIDPFNQPDVASAKHATSAILEHKIDEIAVEGDVESAFEFASAQAQENDYIALMAFVDPLSEQPSRSTLLDGAKRLQPNALTFGVGPRFLHSTGQLHKGGANNVIALQILDRTPTEVVPIPGRDYGFGELFMAQSLGDYQALSAKGRRVLRVTFNSATQR